ncbi:MAG: GTP cyclohydrolase II [Acetobacteraceae bacterium]|nr:GTP cyclohydrolase II [Acetobacteraceae bacterium]MSP30752.1 GTP cyclohydrolase II [Acetobacteraceae bacterium]
MTAEGTYPTLHYLRAVHRAVAELRRGTPVLLRADAEGVAPPLVVLAAETAGATGLAEFSRLGAVPGVLLLAPMRAAAVLHRPVEQVGVAVALRLSQDLLSECLLRGLADPTADQLVGASPDTAPVPALAGAALALAKLGQLLPAVLVAPLRAEAIHTAATLDVLSVSAADIGAYPRAMAIGLRRVAEADVPLENAPQSRIVAFRAPDAGIEHLAIVVGQPEKMDAPLVRLHSECFTGDLLDSLRCDCGAQLRGAIQRMAEDGGGVLLYLAQEGRGIGLMNKLRAYAMQDRGLDTLDANRALGWGADERNFLLAATMLRELGIARIRLLTNNLDKISALVACGVDVVGREAHEFPPNGVNDHYLATKAKRFGHLLG